MEGTRIVLVRHGESRAQELGILGGHDGCQGLSDLGREQVGRLRDRLAATGELAEATALYSSLMPRAIETAEILAPALGGLEVRRGVRLLRGPPRRGRRAHLGGARRALPGGARGGTATRSGRRAGRRGSRWATASPRALESLVERHPGETVVVACHGGVVVHSMLHYLGLDLAGGGDARVDRGGQRVAHGVALRAEPVR